MSHPSHSEIVSMQGVAREWMLCVRAIIGDNHALNARHSTDAGHHAGGRDFLVVDIMCRQRTELQEACPGVDEGGDAVPHEHLAALYVFLPCLLRSTFRCFGVQAAELRYELAHRRGILAVRFAIDVDIRWDDGKLRGLLWAGIGRDASSVVKVPLRCHRFPSRGMVCSTQYCA